MPKDPHKNAQLFKTKNARRPLPNRRAFSLPAHSSTHETKEKVPQAPLVYHQPIDQFNAFSNPPHHRNRHGIAQRLVTLGVRRIRLPTPRHIRIPVRESLEALAFHRHEPAHAILVDEACGLRVMCRQRRRHFLANGHVRPTVPSAPSSSASCNSCGKGLPLFLARLIIPAHAFALK